MGEPIVLDSIYRRSPNALWRSTIDGVIVLSSPHAGPLRLNGTGAEIWALLGEPQTLSSIASELSGRFGTSQQQLSEAVQPLLNELVALNAIESAEPQQ